jgi:APA family basic amino acid/polyamine antiporter
MEQNPTTHSPAKPRLGLWDAVSLIIGIAVGTAIFKSPLMVFQNTHSAAHALGAWLLGGGLAFCGALCYAELATTFPRDGGDYEYLSRAYGRWLGFLFGWCHLTVILSACIGTMAYAFADYAAAIWPTLADDAAWLAAAAVIALSLVNAVGGNVGRNTQNTLSVLKIVGLLTIIAVGCWAASTTITTADTPSSATNAATAATTASPQFAPSFGLAMVFVLYAYGGWNDSAFVAAEVRDQRRNMPRALVIGTLAVTVLYVAVNAAYLAVLGFDAARLSTTPAADVFTHTFGNAGRTAMSLLVMLSALGAINGMIFTGSRVYATVGEDFHAVGWLARWNRHQGVPLAALVVQCASTVLLILAVGTPTGQRWVDRTLGTVGAPSLPWDEYFGGFETLLAGSAPIFWSFFLLTGSALILFRIRAPELERPFRVPIFPLTPLVFCATSVYMIYSSLVYARWLVLLGVVPLLIGAALLVFVRPSGANADSAKN